MPKPEHACEHCRRYWELKNGAAEYCEVINKPKACGDYAVFRLVPEERTCPDWEGWNAD